MKKIININFQGQLITIEETAYDLLNQYIQSLKDYFRRETEGTEIVNDIESRIAELFGNRLKHGITCITDADVESIISTIGKPEEFDMEFEDPDDKQTTMPPPYTGSTESQQMPPPLLDEQRKSLFRKSNDRILGGVCSGLAHYLKIDPVFTRVLFVVLFGFVFWVYIILWIVLPARALPNNVSKRLYRNPNDRFIAGVAGGIAAYFKIDAWIPRVVFLLPLIFKVLGWARFPFGAFNHFNFNSFVPWNLNINLSFSFSFLVAYIVLWIIMPKAVTVKQKLEMMGEDEYLKTIRATVSDNVAQARSSRPDVGNANVGAGAKASVNSTTSTTTTSTDSVEQNHTTNSGSTPAQGTIPPPIDRPHTAYYTSLQSERSGCLNVLVGFFKVVFFGIVGIVAAGLMITLFALIFAGAKFIPLQSLFINPGFEHTLLWLTIVLSLIVPIVGMIGWVVRRVMKAKSRPVIGYAVASLWFVGIVAGLVLGFNITRKFSTESLHETNIELTSPTSNKLYLEMERYPLDYFSVTPRTSKFTIGSPVYSDIEIENLPFFNVEEDSLLFNSIHLRMKTSKDTLFHVKTIYSSSEKNYKSAKANVRNFDFKLEQNDSILFIPQFFKTAKEQGFRNQFVVIEIFVPSGSKLEVSEDLVDYQRNITSKEMSQKYGEDYGRRNSLEWNSNEEYVLEDDGLTETRLLNDTI